MSIVKLRILSLLIALVLAHPVQAADTKQDVTSPNMQDMMKWKSEFLSKYDEIIYLDADSKSVTEAIFFKRIVDEKLGFNMQINSDMPKRITIRLLSDDEQKSAQASVK
jgi:tRNA U34 5-methylaminomethyl-2-thiouridine-forming methyltransferase MnmC